MLTRIRFLFLVLTLSLIGTAVTIHFTITDDDALKLDTKKLTDQIHEYERSIDALWEDTLAVKTFQNADRYPVQISDISAKLAKENIYIYIYKDHQVVHWSNNVYVPSSDLGLRHSTSVLQTENRSFLVKKRILENDISVLALVPIKSNFETVNQYLKNEFIGISDVGNLEIATYDDQINVANIYSQNHTYLFSVKLIDGKKDNIYITLQFFCWVAALFCLLIFSNSVCLHMAKRGHAWFALLLFFSLLMLVRYIDLKSSWLMTHSSLALFDPKYYAYSKFFPNIWSYLMTSAHIFWFVSFAFSMQRYLTVPIFLKGRIVSTVLSTIAILTAYAFALFQYQLLGTLLTHSPINENSLTNVLTQASHIWLYIIIFCLNIASVALYIEVIIHTIRYLLKDITRLLNVQLICIIAATVLIAFRGLGMDILFVIFFGFLLLLSTYRSFKISTPYNLSITISTVLIFSVITVISTDHFNYQKKITNMKQSVSYLLAEDDTNAVALFIDLEQEFNADDYLQNMVNLAPYNASYLTEYIRSKYLSGYLSKFENQIYIYDNEGESLDTYPINAATEYRESVIKNAIKVPSTEAFYRINGELGTHEYFVQLRIPYSDDPEKNYYVYLNLKNISYSTSLPYPEVLSDSRKTSWQFESLKDYSYALYKANSLVTQYGTYDYEETDIYAGNELRKYTVFDRKDDYVHLVYKADQYSTIVLSESKTSTWEYLALGSIIFIILILFGAAVQTVVYLFKTFASNANSWSKIKLQLLGVFNGIRYSTRIQSLVVASVLIGILISGAITFISLNTQLQRSTENKRNREIAEIARKIETSTGNLRDISDAHIVEILKEIAPSTVRNFNLYNKAGKLIYSSQPQIFDSKLLSEYINPNALNKLAALRKMDAYEHENIGGFNYASAYATIKDEDYRNVAYLNIPYYTTEKESNASKSLLLNTLLNIYTLIIILFGFVASFLASKITKPLDIVRQKLAETQLSNKVNEPLFWSRDDEIGMLVKEYNYMLVKMEESAKHLRDAEREKAWREMAKQIAHEIKNPLTPMKLGIQQLMRSYNEHDHRFAERFNKTSASIIEQIDSLSKIATEFSAFAKLPETNLVKINLIEKIQKIINLFNHSANTYISLTNTTGHPTVYILGDRDQLLRSFNNLFKNSIEASLGRKKLLIEIIVRAQDENWVQIVVKDNGYGIPTDVIPNIFKPNFTTKSSGTGLGLAFVKQTVTGAGGKIEFNTVPNKGTTFTITLPTYRDSDQEEEA